MRDVKKMYGGFVELDVVVEFLAVIGHWELALSVGDSTKDVLDADGELNERGRKPGILAGFTNHAP